MTFSKILVANRGAVAARVLRATAEMSMRSVCVYSEADANLPYLAHADETYSLGAGPPRENYLDPQAILKAARATKSEAIHPGYGFLSENAEFAREVRANGIAFIGPNPDIIETMGHKTKARDLVASLGMPLGIGSEVLPKDAAAITAIAERIGYPVLVKPTAGGGGIGMIAARGPAELASAVERAQSMALRGFGSPDVYLERLLERPRHIEIQVVGDQYGRVRHLFERDCSVQRRHQKVIEEALAPGVPRSDIDALCARVIDVMERIGYDNVGTVEMLMGADGTFHFLEMNTRLQVEHGITEEITGVDLVKAQIRLAAWDRLAAVLPEHIIAQGHAIQARVYAEDPRRFLPSPGKLEVFRPPTGEGIRIETGYAEGAVVSPFYDPLLAKVIARGTTRDDAIGRLEEALSAFEITGVKQNIPALLQVLGTEAFRVGNVHTGLLYEAVPA
jgi:acetyl-CoA carboxylase biotin carboxylase subunit